MSTLNQNVMSKFNYSGTDLCTLFINLNLDLKKDGAKSNVFLTPTLKGDDVFALCFPEDNFFVGSVEKKDGVWYVDFFDEMFEMYKKEYGYNFGYVLSLIEDSQKKKHEFTTTEDF